MLSLSLSLRPRSVARTLSTAARTLSTAAGPRQLAIEERLRQVFEPTHLEVVNESHGRKQDESHFKVVVISEAFEKQRLLARHRLVNAALTDGTGALPFHSLSVAVAKTPAEWGDCSEVRASPKCAGGDGRGMKL